MRTTLRGIPGRRYRLQSSDDRLHWTVRATLATAVVTARAVFTHPAPLPARRFYRTLQP